MPVKFAVLPDFDWRLQREGLIVRGGANWGLFTATGAPKPGMQAAFDARQAGCRGNRLELLAVR